MRFRKYSDRCGVRGRQCRSEASAVARPCNSLLRHDVHVAVAVGRWNIHVAVRHVVLLSVVVGVEPVSLSSIIRRVVKGAGETILVLSVATRHEQNEEDTTEADQYTRRNDSDQDH